MSTPVVLRSARELAAALANNPFLTRTAKTDTFHVMFLADAPKPSAVAKLDPNRSKPDRFTVVGREIYLLCPNGLGRSKLTNDYFDRQLGTISTCRNWRTISKLSELLAS